MKRLSLHVHWSIFLAPGGRSGQEQDGISIELRHEDATLAAGDLLPFLLASAGWIEPENGERSRTRCASKTDCDLAAVLIEDGILLPNDSGTDLAFFAGALSFTPRISAVCI